MGQRLARLSDRMLEAVVPKGRAAACAGATAGAEPCWTEDRCSAGPLRRCHCCVCARVHHVRLLADLSLVLRLIAS
jgi:hypothetical protein